VASPYLTQEKVFMPDLEWMRTVEAKKLFLSIANQELAAISPTIDYGRTGSEPLTLSEKKIVLGWTQRGVYSQAGESRKVYSGYHIN
jgi:hypothetical protein